MSQFGRAAGLAGFADLAREVGLDPYRVAAMAKVPRAALTDSDMKVASRAMSRAIELAAELSDTADFGLRLAGKRRLADMGALGLALREQPTLRASIALMAKYAWMQNEALSLRLEESGDIAVVTLGLAAWRGRQATELLVAVLARSIQSLRTPTWRPLEVRFMHAAPANLDAHRQFFGVTPIFEQDFLGVVFRRLDLDAPNTAADPAMAMHTARYIEHLAGGRGACLAAQVLDMIVLLLPGGGCSVDRTAERLGMDRRTLHRRLSAEGTSFSGLLEEARGDLAISLLANSERSLQSIAEILGFASLSAFGHWFRRRFDCTASSYRAARQASARPALREIHDGAANDQPLPAGRGLNHAADRIGASSSGSRMT